MIRTVLILGFVLGCSVLLPAQADPLTRSSQAWPRPEQIETAFAKVRQSLPSSVSWHLSVVSDPDELPVLTVISPASRPGKNTFCLVQFNRGSFDRSWREEVLNVEVGLRKPLLETILAHEAAHCLERDQYYYSAPPPPWQPISVTLLGEEWAVPVSEQELALRRQRWAETYADAFSFLYVTQHHPKAAKILVPKILQQREQWAQRDPGYQTHRFLRDASFKLPKGGSLQQTAFSIRYEGFLLESF